MKITKFGHSCMLVEEGETRILIDPGKWSTKQNDIKSIDAILITHEHPDHIDPASIKTILENSPNVKIYTNEGVGKVLSEQRIAFELLKNGQNSEVNGVLVEAFGEKHIMIHPSVPVVDDTGYLIAEKFYYAGDAFHLPKKQVEILAWPAYTPWATYMQAIDFAKQVKPKICFPVHDAILKFRGPSINYSRDILKADGIEFKVLEEGKEYDFI